uniref:Uncharacterized protein n=1 Tax=Lygus hesperus TaxID=30085 RepID=A0A0A9Z847_LYGHE
MNAQQPLSRKSLTGGTGTVLPNRTPSTNGASVRPSVSTGVTDVLPPNTSIKGPALVSRTNMTHPYQPDGTLVPDKSAGFSTRSAKQTTGVNMGSARSGIAVGAPQQYQLSAGSMGLSNNRANGMATNSNMGGAPPPPGRVAPDKAGFAAMPGVAVRGKPQQPTPPLQSSNPNMPFAMPRGMPYSNTNGMGEVNALSQVTSPYGNEINRLNSFANNGNHDGRINMPGVM